MSLLSMLPFDVGLAFVNGDIESLFDAFCLLAENSFPLRVRDEVKSHYGSRNILSEIT